ncbi:MAG: Na+/H+ antiporter subunit B [Candidatus Promineifilaceae bacterium]
MRSLILSTATRFLLPLLLLFSIFVLLRGHNDPGGGFIGGLVASAAFALYALAFDVRAARRALRISPRTLIASGLCLALMSGLFPLFIEAPFMKGLQAEVTLPVIGHPSVPLFFDTGVYFVVIGVVVTIVFTFFESEEF